MIPRGTRVRVTLEVTLDEDYHTTDDGVYYLIPSGSRRWVKVGSLGTVKAVKRRARLRRSKAQGPA